MTQSNAQTARKDASDILKTLDLVEGASGYTQAELAKQLKIPSKRVGAALKLLVGETSIEKFKNGTKAFKYRAIPVDAEPITDDDTSAEASEEAILKAEGMHPADAAVERGKAILNGTQSVVPDENGNAQLVDGEGQPTDKAKRKRTRATADEVVSLKVAFDIGFDLVTGNNATEVVRAQLERINEDVRRSAVERCLKSVAKNLEEEHIEAHYTHLKQALTVLLDEMPKAQRKGGGGKRGSGVLTVYGASGKKSTRGRISLMTEHFKVGTRVKVSKTEIDGKKAIVITEAEAD